MAILKTLSLCGEGGYVIDRNRDGIYYEDFCFV